MNEIQALIQGGAVGIALLSLWIIYKMSVNHTKHIEDATDRFTQAMDRNSDAWVKNAEALGKLSEQMDRKV